MRNVCFIEVLTFNCNLRCWDLLWTLRWDPSLCENLRNRDLSKSLHLLSVLWWNSFNKVPFKEKQLTFFKSSQKSPFNLKDLVEIFSDHSWYLICDLNVQLDNNVGLTKASLCFWPAHDVLLFKERLHVFVCSYIHFSIHSSTHLSMCACVHVAPQWHGNQDFDFSTRFSVYWIKPFNSVDWAQCIRFPSVRCLYIFGITGSHTILKNMHTLHRMQKIRFSLSNQFLHNE